MTTPVEKPASLYLMILKSLLGLALVVTFMGGTIWAAIGGDSRRPWLLLTVAANALIMIVVGVLRALEQARNRAAAAPPAPGTRRMAGVGRGPGR